MARGKKRRLTFAEAQTAGRLGYRRAHKAYGIGYQRWKKLREERGFLPFGGSGHGETADQQAELRARIEASVKEKPHLNTAVRAKEVGCSTGTCQKVLRDLGLTKLHARLEHAGYRVERCEPLRVARQRRIVATYPGSLAQIDCKTFGFLRGTRHKETRRLGGFVVERQGPGGASG